MKRAAQVQVADQLHVLPVVVHHVELEIRKRETVIRQEAIAAGREHNPPIRKWAGAEIEDSVSEVIRSFWLGLYG